MDSSATHQFLPPSILNLSAEYPVTKNQGSMNNLLICNEFLKLFEGHFIASIADNFSTVFLILQIDFHQGKLLPELFLQLVELDAQNRVCVVEEGSTFFRVAIIMITKNHILECFIIEVLNQNVER